MCTQSNPYNQILVPGAAVFFTSQGCEMLLEKGEPMVGLDYKNNYYNTFWIKWLN
jgi:hypothetical protein